MTHWQNNKVMDTDKAMIMDMDEHKQGNDHWHEQTRQRIRTWTVTDNTMPKDMDAQRHGHDHGRTRDNLDKEYCRWYFYIYRTVALWVGIRKTAKYSKTNNFRDARKKNQHENRLWRCRNKTRLLNKFLTRSLLQIFFSFLLYFNGIMEEP